MYAPHQHLPHGRAGRTARPARPRGGISRAELIRRLLDRLLDTESDRLGADVAAIDASFGLLADVEIELDRADGARGEHFARIANA